jgi:TPR repeat protein
MLRRWLGAALMAGLALPQAVAAGPQEDYEIGRRSYTQGDVAGAMAALGRAADGGHAAAAALLGFILDAAGEDAEAVKYYRIAAEQGDADGEYGLGKQYSTGEGIKADPKQAFEWIGRAAAKGHKSAISALADAYLHGGLGLDAAARADNEAALKWIQAAADNNYLPAMVAMSNAYRKGQYGLAPDPAKAKAWDDRIKAVTARPKPEKK